ncbi:MAG: HAMP domain-containing histidine kinase [Gracilibacteraceae bacterium]|nr:HAMP domain-containing histidine kinase [Gracilibacteraceae bacterium]
MSHDLRKSWLKKRWGLTISLVLFVFAVMMAAMMLAGFIVIALHLAGVLPFWEGGEADYEHDVGGGPLGVVFVMMAFSVLLGTTMAAFFSKKALKPIRKVVDATHRVAGGDFDVRVDLRGIYELEALSQGFNKMAQELSSIETLRGDFINNFSHEFKTPIGSIRGYAKLLRDGSLSDAEKQEYLDIIITEAERLGALATNILNLSKFEALEIVTDKMVFRLDEQIRRALVLTEPRWSAKGVAVDVELEEILYDGNEDLTQQVWLNLLDNAIKFTERGGTISVRLDRWGGGIRFRIRDDGVGMDELTAARVFDKFFQGDNSRVTSGNGLGLAIVKRIVDLYGGHVEVRSEVGAGSEFWVIF